MAAFSLSLALLAAGCLQPQDRSVGETSPPVDQTLKSGVNLLPVNAPTTYVIVETPLPYGKIMTRESLSEASSTPKELFLRIYDSNGTPHDRVFTIPAKGPGAITTFDFDYPEKAPYLVTVECGCVLAWLMNVELNPAVHMGDVSLMRNATQKFVLQYGGSAGDVSEKEALQDAASYAQNISVIHWGFAWDNNMHGNASLITPSGRQLAYWELDGRRTAGGHVSNGSTPLEVGNWSLEMHGLGWFEFDLRQYYLPDAAWESLGFKSPRPASSEAAPGVRDLFLGTNLPETEPPK
jgi:hypothetical protein